MDDVTRLPKESAPVLASSGYVDGEDLSFVVFFRIVVRRTWLVLALSSLAILPIAMSGTFAGEQLALELMIALSGIALVFAVLLRFGFLALVVMFYTFLSITYFPLTTDMARPYAGASVVLQVGVATLAAYGF